MIVGEKLCQKRCPHWVSMLKNECMKEEQLMDNEKEKDNEFEFYS